MDEETFHFLVFYFIFSSHLVNFLLTFKFQKKKKNLILSLSSQDFVYMPSPCGGGGIELWRRWGESQKFADSSLTSAGTHTHPAVWNAKGSMRVRCRLRFGSKCRRSNASYIAHSISGRGLFPPSPLYGRCSVSFRSAVRRHSWFDFCLR